MKKREKMPRSKLRKCQANDGVKQHYRSEKRGSFVVSGLIETNRKHPTAHSERRAPGEQEQKPIRTEQGEENVGEYIHGIH